ncbi:CDX2 protein, partial [Tyrannus savana]|nr:CDX2 protein [Tyrannus savana]
SPGPAWPAPYGAPLRDDWGTYGQGAPQAAGAVHGLNGGSPAAPMAYSPADYHHHHHHPHAHHHAGPAPHCSAGVMQPLNAASAAASAAPEPLSPGGQRRGLCEWMRKPAQPPLSSQVKTRTKDKYRVVYTDHQRLELEKEFHYSRYITIRRKAELASNLGLSERQVKIWFQNRRAKERKINKKKLQQAQPGGAESLSPSASLQGPAAGAAAGRPPLGSAPPP